VSDPVVIRFKFRYHALTTVGRAESRVGLQDADTNQLYHVAVNAKNDAAPLSLVVKSTSLDIGTVGDQNLTSLWEVEALFDRTGSSETMVDYTVWRDGVIYASDTAILAEAVDGSTLFDEGYVQFRQNARISLDDLQLSWGAIADTTAPATPSSLSVTGSYTSVTLSWIANSESDLAGYEVYRHDGTAFQLIDGNVVENSYVDSNSVSTGNIIESDTTYAYQVTAIDRSGNESAIAASGSAMTLPARLAKPTGVTAVGGDEEVGLSWVANPEPHFEYYELQRTDIAEGAFTTLSATLTAAAYTDSSLTNGEDYYYRVRAIDDGGNTSAWSATTSAEPDKVVLTETWERTGLVPEELSGSATLEAKQSWTLNAANHVVEVIDTAGFGSRAFGRPDLDAVGGGDVSLNDSHYANLEHALQPGTHDIRLAVRAVFMDTTTSGRSELRFGLTDDDIAPIDGYKVVLNANTSQSPFTFSVGNASVNIGTVGDQSNGSVWDVEATFTRLSVSSTQVDYVIVEDGATYAAGSTTVAAGLSGSLDLTLARLEVRQRGTVVVDDLEVSY
jgi:hypothetical protein